MKKKLKNEKYIRQIASSILAQLGGNEFLSMTGGEPFIGVDKDKYQNPYLVIRGLTLTKKGISQVKVTYIQGVDVYKMTFLNGDVVVKEYEDVYCDDLIPFFEKETGLYCTLQPNTVRFGSK